MYTISELAERLSFAERHVRLYLEKYGIAPADTVGDVDYYDDEALLLLELVRDVTESRFFSLNLATHLVELARADDYPADFWPREVTDLRFAAVRRIDVIRDLRARKPAASASSKPGALRAVFGGLSSSLRNLIKLFGYSG